MERVETREVKMDPQSIWGLVNYIREFHFHPENNGRNIKSVFFILKTIGPDRVCILKGWPWLELGQHILKR